MKGTRKLIAILFSILFMLGLSFSISAFAVEPEDLTNTIVRDVDGDVVTVKWDPITNCWRCFKEDGRESIHSGLAPNENGMWYCSIGRVQFDYTNFVQFEGDTWYVKDGKVATDYTGELPDGNMVYLISGGKLVDKHYSDEYQKQLEKKENDDAISLVFGLAVLVVGVFIFAKLFPPKAKKKSNNTSNYPYKKSKSYKPSSNEQRDKVYYAKKVGVENLHYKKRQLLTDREEEFYTSLQPIADRLDLIVHPKVRVADLVDVDGSKYTQEGKTAWHSIIGTHVDFVLVDKQTNEPALLIELDDSTHYNERTQFTDEVKNHVFKDAGYKLLRVVDDIDLENKIKGMLDK